MDTTVESSLEVCAPLASALDALLIRLAEVLGGLDDASYTARPADAGSSVGAHVRHSLDHVRALLDAARTGELDYDARARGTPVETSRPAALALIARLRADLVRLEHRPATAPVRLATLPEASAEPVTLESTLGREAAYVLSHTVHHNALIASLIRAVGADAPADFGWAPSTVRHARGGAACAR